MDDTVVVKGCSLTSLHGPTNFLPLGGRLPNTLCTPERKLLTSERLRDCGVVAAAWSLRRSLVLCRMILQNAYGHLRIVTS